jgi:hypothetical protein
MPRRHHRVKKRLPLLPLVGLGIGASRGIYDALDHNWSNAKAHPEWVLNGLGVAFVGYDYINKKTNFSDAFYTYGFALVGYIAHRFLTYLGINRHMPDGISL